MLGETQKQFSLTRAASSKGGGVKRNLSVTAVLVVPVTQHLDVRTLERVSTYNVEPAGFSGTRSVGE